MKISNQIVGVLFLLFLSNTVFAVSQFYFDDSPLLPGTKIVPGDLSKNEFFILAENEVVIPKKVVAIIDKKKPQEKHIAVKKLAHIKPNQKVVKRLIHQIKIALKDAAANVQSKKDISKPYIPDTHRAIAHKRHKATFKKRKLSIANKMTIKKRHKLKAALYIKKHRIHKKVLTKASHRKGKINRHFKSKPVLARMHRKKFTVKHPSHKLALIKRYKRDKRYKHRVARKHSSIAKVAYLKPAIKKRKI